MAKFTASQPTLPTDAESVDSRFMRRPVKGIGAQVSDTLTRPDTVIVVMLLSALIMLIMPWTFIISALVATDY